MHGKFVSGSCQACREKGAAWTSPTHGHAFLKKRDRAENSPLSKIQFGAWGRLCGLHSKQKRHLFSRKSLAVLRPGKILRMRGQSNFDGRSLVIRFVGLVILGLSLLVSAPAGAADLAVSRAVLEDPSAQLELSDVLKREFSPVGLTFYDGYSQSAYWMRITVHAPDEGRKAYLLIRQPFLNEVRLFEPDATKPSGWASRVTGSHYAYSEGERLRHTLGFRVKLDSPETTYYLRVKTISMPQLTVEALPPIEAHARVHEFDLLQVFFVTSMVALLIWALHSYLLDRQAVVGLFAIYQAAYVVYGTAITGYFGPLIPEGFPWLSDTLFVLPYCAVGFTCLLFCRTLFRSYEPPPLLMRGLDLMLWAFPLQLLAMALGKPMWAAISNSLLVRLAWWYLALMTFTLRKEQRPSRRMMQIVFSTVTLLFTALWLTYFTSRADTQSYLFGRQVLIANGLIVGILFAALVNAHSRRILQEAQQSSTNLALAERSLQIERQMKLEAEVQARTDYLTGLFNRRHLVDEAEREVERSLRYGHSLAVMMIDIDHFKTVNDTWGHAVGDLVLQRVSLVIRELLRNVDLFGRTGGEEFTVILIETDRAGAIDVAERLRGMVAQAEIPTGDGSVVGVTISLGVTELKGRQLGFTALMNEADQALYRAKQLGRNKVAWSNCA